MSKSKPIFSTIVGGAGIKNQPGPWEERAFPPGVSDGDQTKWPSPPYRKADERNYLRKLATDWASRDGTAKLGVNYYLDQLPHGYGCFEIDQPNGPQIYKRLFGHPSGKFFDSIARFSVHFFWLLDGKQGRCTCVNCGNVKAVAAPKSTSRHDISVPDRTLLAPRSAPSRDRPSSVSSSEDVHTSRSGSTGVHIDRSRRTARGVQESWPVDEEGTRNVYKDAVAAAFKSRDSRYAVDFDLTDKDSIDWNAEREIIPEYLTKVDQQHAFVPRIGELVLWIPTFPENLYLLRDTDTGFYKGYDFDKRKFIGFPRWRAGVVTSVPVNNAKNGPIDFLDLLDTPQKKTELNTAGFRIETMVDPNNDEDKSASKQYKYVALRHIRPLSQWQTVLKGIPQKLLHSSILNALTCMTSISLVDKYKFKGDWNSGGYLQARAVYLGSELVTVGDTVRLMPEAPQSPCTDLLVVNEIRLRIKGFQESHKESHVPTICSEHFVTFYGRAFTTNFDRAVMQSAFASQEYTPEAVSSEDVKHFFRPVGTAEYGALWPLHRANEKLEVSYDQVVGRLYEADAIRLWSGQRQQKWSAEETDARMQPDLGYDMAGIIAGRKWATRTDERIPKVPNDEIGWLISDNRSRALTLETVNGVETAYYDPLRNAPTLAYWRMHMRIIHGEKVTPGMVDGPARKTRAQPNYYYGDEFAVLSESSGGKRRGRPTGSKVINGKLYLADELARNPELLASANANVSNAFGNGDVERGGENQSADAAADDEEGDEIPETLTQTRASKGSSQMASAALVSTDEGDLMSHRDENEEDEKLAVHHRPLHSRLAAYGTVDDLDDDDDVHMEEGLAPPAAWPRSTKNRSRISTHAPSKVQVSKSVENDKTDMLDAVQDRSSHGSEGEDEYESAEDEWDSQKYAEWKNVRNARGGTEESSGGDYQPD